MSCVAEVVADRAHVPRYDQAIGPLPAIARCRSASRPDPEALPVRRDGRAGRDRPLRRRARQNRAPRGGTLAQPAAAADRARHVGGDDVRPARLPHPIPSPALRGHAALAGRQHRLPGQFRGVQLGRPRGRPRAAGGSHHPGLPRLRLAAGPARGRDDELRLGRGARPERELRRPVRRQADALPVGARPAVPGAALGLRRRGRPAHGRDRLAGDAIIAYALPED